MKCFRELQARDANSNLLSEEIETRGYALIRDLASEGIEPNRFGAGTAGVQPELLPVPQCAGRVFAEHFGHQWPCTCAHAPT